MPTKQRTQSGPITSRFIIVSTPEARTLVNSTLNLIDPTSVGDLLVQGLRVASPPWTGEGPPPIPTPETVDNTIVAYWCSWAMDDLLNQAVRQAIREAQWSPRPSSAELTVHTPESLGTVAPLNSGQRLWVFDGTTVTANQVLATLGLARRL